MSKSVKRLFGQFKPANYKLMLDIDEQNMTFSGSVVITGQKAGRPSRRLTFHQSGLKITGAKITSHGKKGEQTYVVDRLNNHNSYDEVRLHCSDMLYPGKYVISLDFTGVITKQMHGLYPCYFTHAGKSKMLIATQFESHHAREVFPCIDEPEAKATFDLTLKTPAGEQVLSNTPVKNQDVKNQKLTTTFETTPVMSSYLLAFVCGEIQAVSAKTKDGVDVNTWGTVAQPKSSLQFANDEAVKILEFFTDYFGTAFPLKKLDQIALPDFESGAMENWGLITYREIALLADAKNRSLTSEQYVAMVVAHEVSHQWFGNLVTMKWWDDLWLNESFASLMEYIALDGLHPDWHVWEAYVSSDVIAASNRDIYTDVQPVRVDVEHPDQIGTLFDPAIVYAKGGRLLKMLREFIGDQAFRQGLKIYFDKHAYQNTTRDDLWAALSTASGLDIQAFMNPWLEQSGMPVITIAGDAQNITASQERFVLDAANDKTTWPIAVLADGVTPKIFAQTKTMLVGTKTPFILNQNGSGHYVVNYRGDDLKAAVGLAFASRQLPSETRVNYLNDLLLLARRGDSPITDILEVVAKSGQEPRDAVWALMSRAVGLAYSLIEGDEAAEQDLKRFRQQVSGGLQADLGWDDQKNDDPNTKLLRLTALSWMLAADDSQTQTEALKRFASAKSIADINSEHRSMIISTIMKSAPAKHMQNLINTYTGTPDPEIQIAITGGLTSLRDPAIGKTLILQALGDGQAGFVRSQDIFRWFACLMRNRYTRQDTWDWFVANWDRLYAEFNDSKSLDSFVIYAAGPINTGEWQTKFNDFFAPKINIISLTRNIRIAQAEITARVAWRTRDHQKIKTFLKKLPRK